MLEPYCNLFYIFKIRNKQVLNLIKVEDNSATTAAHAITIYKTRFITTKI